MAYFPDLSPYAYAGPIPGAVNVGWLDREHYFPKGSVPDGVLRKLKDLAFTPAVRHRGYHHCEFCGPFAGLRWSKSERKGSTVIVVCSKDKIYAAPKLIIHYIEAHSYLPPTEFLQAVEGKPNQSPKPTLAAGQSG